MNDMCATEVQAYPAPQSIKNVIEAMSDGAIAQVFKLEDCLKRLPQTAIETQHDFHAGMYARSICIPAGTMITGALIKIPTMLIMVGNGIVYIGSEAIEFAGYRVVAAEANRKQAFIAKSDVYLTMIFPTSAITVDEAEREFTDQFAELLSRKDEP